MDLISHKSSTFTIIKVFVSMVKNQFSTIVKTFRSDNALELGCNREVSSFFQEEGNAHQTSVRDTPQQNGVIERKHKDLLEVCRALLF